MPTPAMISLVQVGKTYKHSGPDNPPALQDIWLTIQPGEFVAIVGPSGNGKSTLLNLLTGIDQPTQGSITVNGTILQSLNEAQLARWRCAQVGIVFQFFQLLPSLNLLQNVLLPMDFLGVLSKTQRKQRALNLLEQVGLADRAEHLPGQISGGQQQRAAIARALANDAPLIVADEPTGNLDADSADSVFNLFHQLNNLGKTLVMVTHNENLANKASRRLEIRGGRIHLDSADH